MKLIRKCDEADIGLLLEGTFPYVSGGVSSWVNQIIRGFPELSFAICFLGSREQDYGLPRYQLPDNVVHLEAHYLHDSRQRAPATGYGRHGAAIAGLCRLHAQYREAGAVDPGAMLGAVLDVGAAGLTGERVMASEAAWQFIVEQYRAYCTDPSFIDYFWTVKIMHAPLWQLLEISSGFPKVRALHSVSTGYAGFLGALLRQRQGRPLILSEHGIYTKERKIDLFQARWVKDNRGLLEKSNAELAYFRSLWIRFFEALGRDCYGSADHIIALYEANRQRQITDGAPAEKTRCIPNGVDLERLTRLLAQRQDMPPVACFIGRVVPIKDIKTFIRAMHSALQRMPALEAWIAGPEDEDPAYARDCRSLVEALGLGERIKFLGFQQIDTLLPKIGLIVLSSISEALPLVILEGYAAGVPCVSTDVGSCRQLIEGWGEEDRALGCAGRVVGIADPQALADAVVAMLSDPALWHQAQCAGLERVWRFYSQQGMFARYREVYGQVMVAP